MRIDFSQRLLLCRRDLDLTQAELARRAGNLSPSYVSDLERSKVANPTLDVVQKLAQILGVHPAYLVGWSDDPLGGSIASEPEMDPEQREEIEELIQIYLGLPEENRRLFLQVLEQLRKASQVNVIE